MRNVYHYTTEEYPISYIGDMSDLQAALYTNHFPHTWLRNSPKGSVPVLIGHFTFH